MDGIPQNLSFSGTANVDESESIKMKIPLIVTANFYRKINGEISITNVYYPSVILAMATKLLHSDISNITTEKGFVVIKDSVYLGNKTDFKIPVDQKLQMNINFKSSPGSGYIHKVSLKEISALKLPRNSIIFIGMYSKYGAYDVKNSPVGEMYGIEFNAYALGTILQRDFVNTFPIWLEILYLLLLTSFIGYLVSKGTKATILAAILSFIIPAGLGLLLFFFNYQIITFIPVISSILALLALQIYIMLTEQREKRFIQSTFSSYLNPKLVDILIQNPEMVRLGGEDKEVTIFFAAIHGLESISDSMSAVDFIEYLNKYFSTIGDIVTGNDGTLDKYMGDTLMAFWGAPIDITDHALKACRASLKVVSAIKLINDEQIKKGLNPITAHIGINTGNIVVGNVGSEMQKNYTVIGDSVNLASRLKGLNSYFHTNIIISEFTYEKVKENVIVRELDLAKVKGKTKPVRIYELLDIKRAY